MPVWKWQTEIAITLYWSMLQRYRRFWQDSFVFWIRYKAAVFGLWARPSLLASCLPRRSPYPPRLPGKRRADFLLLLIWEPVLLLCGWKEECERGERWRKQCRVHKTWWLAPLECAYYGLWRWGGICISIGLDLDHGWNCFCFFFAKNHTFN